MKTRHFGSREEYVLHLMHTKAYLQASTLACGKRVLDLGCNTGYGARLLAETAASVVGVDVSKNAIAVARDAVRDDRVEFVVIDGKRLPFPEESFDVVTAFQVVEHIVDQAAFMGEIKRVLAPGAVVLLTTPNAVIRLDPGMRPWNEFHVREFTGAQLHANLKAFFEQVGVYGLFANDPLYSIERQRVGRAREFARERERGRHSTRSAPFRVLSGIVTSARRATSALTAPYERSRLPAFIKAHGAQELHYRHDEMDEALDLLAICTDDEGVFTVARRHFSER